MGKHNHAYKFIGMVIIATLLVACSTSPKQSESVSNAREHQARFYDEEARAYNELGNEEMAAYFSDKADETRRPHRGNDYDFIDFVFDIFFD